MVWDDLAGHFGDFNAATAKIRIVTWAGAGTLDQFPRNLPSEEQEQLKAGLARVAQALRRAVEDAKAGAAPPAAEEQKPVSTQKEAENATGSKIIVDVLALVVGMSTSTSGDTIRKSGLAGIDFGRLLREQELVLLIAQLEAFLANALRAVCLARPERLASGKRLTREEVIKAGSWEGLISQLADTAAFEVGQEPLGPRLRLIRETWGADLKLTESEIAELDQLEAVRHVTLHNGGRVSLEFLRRTGRRELMIGDLVPIDEEAVRRAGRLVAMAATDIFLGCGRKFLGMQVVPTSAWCDGEVLARHGMARSRAT